MDIDTPMDVDTDDEQQIQPAQSHFPMISWVPPPSKSEHLSGLYDLYDDAEGLWVVYRWKDSDDARIEPFYNRWPPSRTSDRACAWISVDRGLSPYKRGMPPEEHEAKFKLDVEGLRTEFASIVEGGAVKITAELIDSLAVKYGVLNGKWLVYAQSEEVDQLWRKVARVVAFDRSHGQLKVSTRKTQNDGQPFEVNAEGQPIWDGGVPISGEGHVICVYVEDYLNKKGVDDLRKALRLGAGVHWAIGFKSDAYTYLNIYKGNKWGLRPSRYHDNDGWKGRGGFGRI
jgi:hypothetical protein